MKPSPALLSIGVALAVAGTAAAEPASWVFQPSTFTHDRMTGARVAQYAPIAPVEGLPDPRLVTSGYRRTRTTLPGPNGSLDTSYQVQSFANGRGGIDAEWERVADEWRASFLTGSFYNQTSGFGAPGFVGPGFGNPGFGGPGFVGPGFGAPRFGGPGFGVPVFFPPGYGYPGHYLPGFYQPGFGYPGYGHPGHGSGRGGQRPDAGGGS